MDISAMRNSSGTRLAYVVVKIEGKLMREQYGIVRKKSGISAKGDQLYTHDMTKRMVEEPGGYMVYFPRGHVIRMRTLEDLEHYELKVGKAPLINISGLNDPNSPLGRMLQEQDAGGRQEAWASLEQQVIKLAIAKTGPIIMPEQVAERPRAPVAA